jgi:hypothetical protein
MPPKISAQDATFIQRCVEAFKLADHVIYAYENILTPLPATHPAYSKIFELAYQEIEKRRKIKNAK